MEINQQQVDEAIGNLSKSERGQVALRDLYQFLNNQGCRLDEQNKTSVVTILLGAWGPETGTTLEKVLKAT